ncbi:uncharacterized protein LOC131678704 [Topomyia yanbarensis]|uniref:uncharacterized protein LOC131678704 n=1 Tax=Topomyia yanbarensis TaxID=2498891 RepID=UPI00273C0DC5|nr:uncharacterized protein LOC131678704 [Topomyia yanbarensis]
MINRSFVSLSVILFLVLVSTTCAIKCYRCNSNNDPACLDVFVESSQEHNNSSQRNIQLEPFLQECGPDENGRNPFCRKISVTVLKENHRRVVRECGYEKSKNNCYQADNDDHLETVCQCWTDRCNKAAGLGHGLAAFAIIFLLRLCI